MSHLIQWFESFQIQHGARPTAVEAYHAGHDPRLPRTRFGSWMEFVQANGDFGELEMSVVTTHRKFFSSLESTPMSRSYKMVLLLGMISRGLFPGKIDIDQLCEGFAQLAHRSALLADDMGPDLDSTSRLRRKIEQNPINAWTGAGAMDQVYFRYENGVFSSTLSTGGDDHANVVRELTREICEWRLAEYINRAQPESS